MAEPIDCSDGMYSMVCSVFIVDVVLCCVVLSDSDSVWCQQIGCWNVFVQNRLNWFVCFPSCELMLSYHKCAPLSLSFSLVPFLPSFLFLSFVFLRSFIPRFISTLSSSRILCCWHSAVGTDAVQRRHVLGYDRQHDVLHMLSGPICSLEGHEHLPHCRSRYAHTQFDCLLCLASPRFASPSCAVLCCVVLLMFLYSGYYASGPTQQLQCAAGSFSSAPGMTACTICLKGMCGVSPQSF